MRSIRGQSHAMPALVVAPLFALMLAACSSQAEPKLPVYTGGTSPSTTFTSGSTTGTTGATGMTPSNTATTAANGLLTTNTIVRGDVAASIPTSSKLAVDAYYVYWTYVAKASLDPGAAGAVENIGTVASGSAATNLISKLSGLKGRQQHTVGSTRVNILSLSQSGASAKLCSTLQDSSVDVDATGAPVQPPVLRLYTFKATLALQGPAWRVDSNSSAPSC